MTTTAAPDPAPVRSPLPQALAGSTAVLIGGTAGIGLATAELLAAAGARVVLAGRDPERLDGAVRRVRAAVPANGVEDGGDGPVLGVVADVRDERTVEEVFARAGAVDHVLLTAGGFEGAGPLADLTRAGAQAAFESRLWGALAVARSAAPRLAPGGSVTFSSGVLVTRPRPGLSALLGVAGGIEPLTRALAVELAPRRLRVNAVRFGIIDTALSRRAAGAEEARSTPVPLGRMGTPEEAASAVLFMMANTYVTGEILTVDGGFSIG